MNAQNPNRQSGWGSVLDIEIYLNVTEPMHPSQRRDGIQIRFRILLRYCKGSEHLKITQFLPSLMAAWAADRRAMGTRKGEQDT